MQHRTVSTSILLAGLLAVGAAQAQTAPAAGTSNLPPSAGEASTQVNGQPNRNPNNPLVTKSREERKAEKEMKRAEAKQRRETAVMGQRGATAGAPAGTPAVSPAGNPPVQAGGTPK